MTISLHDQAHEVELHACGLRDEIDRFGAKRPREWVDRRRERLLAARAAAASLREMAEKQGTAS